MTDADGHDDPLEEQPVVERVQLAYGLVALLTMRSTAPPIAARRPPAGALEADDLFSRPCVPPPWL